MKANMQISRLVTAGLKVKTGVLGGKLLSNHARPSLKMETAVKGARIAANHRRGALAWMRARAAAGNSGRAREDPDGGA